MATFEKRTDRDGNVISIRVKIRRKGLPATSKNFDVHGPRQADVNATMRLAEQWARQIESEMDRGMFVSRTESEQTTLAECLQRYEREITPQKKGADSERYRINTILQHTLSPRTMASIRGADLATYRDDRLQAVKPASVIRELALISHVFNIARREWQMENLSNPVELVRKPKLPKGRDRRLLPGELDALLAATESADIVCIMQLAVETAMRRSEFATLAWEHVNLGKRYLMLRDTKNGDARAVPLSTKAIKLLKAMPGERVGRVFRMRADSITQAFERARDRARVSAVADAEQKGIRLPKGFLEDLRLHDLRHEATSRLIEKGLNVVEAASVTGHKDLRMLKRYTHLNATDLAKKLG
jgi:integrase